LQLWKVVEGSNKPKNGKWAAVVGSMKQSATPDKLLTVEAATVTPHKQPCGQGTFIA
jgi:hypothetical protein